MHFYNTLLSLCEKQKIKITPLISELGLSKGNITSWKRGTIPNGDVLLKIANYFDTSVDYLLGNEKVYHNESSLTDKQKLALKLADKFSKEDIEKLIDINISVTELISNSNNSNNANLNTQELELIEDWRKLNLNGQFKVVQALNTAKEEMEFSESIFRSKEA